MNSATVTEQSVPVNGINVHLALAGDPAATPVILLHGIADRWERWAPVIDRLAASHFLIMPDLRGHARSDKPDNGYAPENVAADVAGVFQELGIESGAIVGHSLGAVIAARLAADYPRLVQCLVLEDPPFEVNAQLRESMQYLREARRGTFEETRQMVSEMYWYLDESAWQRIANWLRDTADGPFKEAIRAIDENLNGYGFEFFPKIACPTLLLQGDPSSGGVLSHEVAGRVRQAIPHCQLMLFSNTGHSIHDERPDDFVDAVIAFLKRTG